MVPTRFGISQSVLRKEDDALIRGHGRYVADIAPKGALAAVVVRSPHAHARFRITDAERARAMPGVHLVLTAGDVRDLGNLPCVALPPGLSVDAPPYPVLAGEEVRHVGDAVAFIVADTAEQARDAAEAIAIDWQPLPPVVSAVAALKPGAPQVWPGHKNNIALTQTIGDEKATARAFAAAAKTVSLDVVNQRLVTNYMDTRGVIAEYDAASDASRSRSAARAPHHARDIIWARGAANCRPKNAGNHARRRRWLRHQAVSLSRICAGRRCRRAAAASR